MTTRTTHIKSSADTATPDISVIVPVFNAGPYLRPCLESLAAQTFRSVEFLLVLDCPSDGSDTLCRHYASTDKRFRIIENTHNMHIGLSRNRGIEAARGHYIGFADHDDTLEPTMYEQLYHAAIQTDADIAMGIVRATLKHDDSNVDHLPDISEMGDLRFFCLHDLLSSGGQTRHNSYFAAILGNIYRRDMLMKHQLRFVDSRVFTPEDLIFNVQAFHAAQHFAVVDHVVYHHINHASNAGLDPAYRDYRRRSETAQLLSRIVEEWDDADDYRYDLQLGIAKQAITTMAETLVFHPLKTWRVSQHLRHTDVIREAVCNYHDDMHRSLPKRLFRRLVLSLLGA